MQWRSNHFYLRVWLCCFNTMCADTVNWSYEPLINWPDSSAEFVSLLHSASEEQDDYYASYRFRGRRNYLARQAFLRSYKFRIEESFKDKLRKSIRRLNEESFEELLKKSLGKLIRNTKSFVNRCHCDILLANKSKQRRNLWPVSCFSPFEEPAASQHDLSRYYF